MQRTRLVYGCSSSRACEDSPCMALLRTEACRAQVDICVCSVAQASSSQSRALASLLDTLVFSHTTLDCNNAWSNKANEHHTAALQA